MLESPGKGHQGLEPCRGEAGADRGITYWWYRELLFLGPNIPPKNSRERFSAAPDRAFQLHTPGGFSNQLPETPKLEFRVVTAAQVGDFLFQPTVALREGRDHSSARKNLPLLASPCPGAGSQTGAYLVQARGGARGGSAWGPVAVWVGS